MRSGAVVSSPDSLSGGRGFESPLRYHCALMNVQPTRDVDYRDAEKTLVLHLKAKGMAIKGCGEWARWTYGSVPFWSVWGIVYGENFAVNFCGIHIYDDGRVEIIYSTENLEEWSKNAGK